MTYDEKIKRIKDLIIILNKATEAYDMGNPLMPDQMWDDLYMELVRLENETKLTCPESPSQSIHFEVKNKLEKITHEHLMLSLDKTKDINVVKSFLGDREWVAMGKMDGLTCSLTYENGILVRAETRGNGEIGEDILHNALVNKTIPKHIPYRKRVVIDGEIICTYQNFEKYKDEFKNPRNFAAGSIRLLDSKECYNRDLRFVAWDVIEFIDMPAYVKEPHSLIHQLGILEDWHFYCPPVIWQALGSKCTVEEAIEHITIDAKESGYPIDGVVFKFNDLDLRESLGNTSHHFNNAIAYKFYDEEYETILRQIEWTMGRTGQLTPVAVFDPIDDGESIITRASLHNVSVMKQLLGEHPYVGEKICVIKSNQIIPQIIRSYPNDDDWLAGLVFMDTCPICGQPTIIKKENDSEILYCTNSECAGKLINQLDHFVGKKGLDIKGLSKATLEKLIDLGWVKNKIDIFSLFLHRDAWARLPGFGDKSVNNILESIESARSCELFQFISSLGIPLIGLSYAKEICKNEYDWHNIREDIAGGYDFTKWNGFGPELNDSLHSFDYSEADKIANLLQISNTLWSASNSDLKVCITGNLHIYKNRIALTQAIEKIGGKVTSSISKNTTLLINNDANSNSRKNLDARQLGIPIVTEEEFRNTYLTI